MFLKPIREQSLGTYAGAFTYRSSHVWRLGVAPGKRLGTWRCSFSSIGPTHELAPSLSPPLCRCLVAPFSHYGNSLMK